MPKMQLHDAHGQWAELEPYAQLIGALLPRAAGITVFDVTGNSRWTSENSVPVDLPRLVRLSVAASASGANEYGERVSLGGEAPIYLFWLRNESGELVAIVALTWRTGDSEMRTFAFVHGLVKPAIECLRRELLARARLETMKGASDRDGDLDVLLLATSTPDARGDSGDDIKNLLQSATDHMKCEFAALIMPERNLVVIRTEGGRKMDTSIVARIHRHLLSLAQVRPEPAILNSPTALQGINLPMRVLSSPVRGPSGRPNGVLALFRSPTRAEFRAREAQLAELLARRASATVEASFDSLSGLLTRNAFEHRARVAIAARKDDRAANWSYLYIDVDRMHVINENHGMHVGDKLIAKIGELVRSRTVPGSVAARTSGDRFAILLPTGGEDAMAFSEALRQGVASLSLSHLGANADANFAASVSIGVSSLNDTRMDLSHAAAAAETASKAAKDRGRNRVELYQVTDVSIMRRFEDMNIAPNLRAAMAENRLRLDSQLIVPLNSTPESVPHFELLLRMIDMKGETVGPERFLSAAVRYQMMPEVDRWVVTQALSQLKPHADMLASRPVIFTINLSGQSLGEVDFADFLVKQIKDSGINPKVICFEITETAAIANMAKAEGLMRRVRSLGCTFALDDFGTGLSSLAYLRSLPVDMLKIDGSFVRDILKDQRAESMVQAIAHLATSMNLTTVAEYVETDEIRLRLATLGVDYGQGFAISRPVPLTETIDELPMYCTAAAFTLDSSDGDEIVLSGDDINVEDDAALNEFARSLMQPEMPIETATLQSIADPIAPFRTVPIPNAGNGSRPAVTETPAPELNDDDAFRKLEMLFNHRSTGKPVASTGKMGVG